MSLPKTITPRAVSDDTWALSVVREFNLKRHDKFYFASRRYLIPDDVLDELLLYLKIMSAGFRIKGQDPDGTIAPKWVHRVIVRYIDEDSVMHWLFVPSVLRTIILINDDSAAYYAEEVKTLKKMI